MITIQVIIFILNQTQMHLKFLASYNLQSCSFLCFDFFNFKIQKDAL